MRFSVAHAASSGPLPPVQARPSDLVPAAGYRRVNTSRGSQLGRAIWAVAYWLLVRPTPRPLHAWRALVLRGFGATIGRGCHVYPGARIWAPWNLVLEDHAAIASGAEIYNPATVTLRAHSIVSQGAFLCGASHDYNDPEFPMIWAPIEIGRFAWVGARATVLMGVTLGEGAVLGLGAIATRDLEAWGVYVGTPARRVASRPAISSP